MDSSHDRSISFSAQVEAVDAASRACLGPARDIRERTPTGFIQDVQVDADEKTVKFGSDVSFVPAASSPASPEQARSVRERTPTGFIVEDAVMAQADERNICFNAQVEAVDAASRACLGPARDIRERTPTGFIQDVQVDADEKTVKFGSDVSFVPAASSPASPEQARSVRERTPTGFIVEDAVMAQADERNISFNAQVEAVDAASRACLGPARDIRDRTPTGFIQDVQVDADEKTVKFGSNVSFVPAASSPASPEQARSIRERTPTGFIAEDTVMAQAGERNISFSAEVEAVDAASKACLGPARDIRDRTPTGFMQDIQADVDEKMVKFGGDVSFVPAASSPASPEQARSIRERTPTGFIADDAVMAQAGERNISFSAEVEAVDAASTACLKPARDIRERTPTGFIQDVQVGFDDKSVKFGGDVSFVQAASSRASPEQARSIRERTPTGFIADDAVTAQAGERNISFSAEVEAVDAASSACLKPARDIRERTPTGFIQDVQVGFDDKSVKFRGDVSFVQAASSRASPEQARSIRERTPTGFIADDAVMAQAGERNISFSAEVEAVDAASRACLKPVRDIRERTPTGFIQDVQVGFDDKSVKFGGDVSFVQAASSRASPEQARSIRERTPTGFIADDAVTAQAGERNISFSAEVEAVDAASSACLKPARDIRERTPTGFIQDVQVGFDDKSVKFGGDVSFVPAASSRASPEQARSIRERTPTGFIADDAVTAQAGERNISFSAEVEAVDAASSACLKPARDIRERTPTGFIQDVQVDVDEKSVKFGDDVSFVPAASLTALPGQGRNLSERIPTGFISEDPTVATQHDEKNISFNAEVETMDAASKACTGPVRDIRERTPTGFIDDTQMDKDEKSVKFGNGVSYVQAASSEARPGQARRLSERIPTGFISEAPAMLAQHDARNISFSAEVEAVDAASRACLGPARDIRERTPTGFIQDVQVDVDEKSVKFGDDVSFVPAASFTALPGQGRNLSERIPTGFISEDPTVATQHHEKNISFNAEVETMDAASKACTGPVRDIRERTPTGFIDDTQMDKDEKSVKFGNGVSYVQAASSEARPGQARRLSERIPTGFISEAPAMLAQHDARNISFSAEVEAVDAASRACLGPARDIRERTPTGFIQDVQVDVDEKSVKFGDDVSFVPAASLTALPGQGRNLSERIPTGFISEDPTVAMQHDEKNISFNVEVETMDAASKACTGPVRDIRERTPTGFIDDTQMDQDEKSVKFKNGVSYVQAASAAALPENARAIRERELTGYVSEFAVAGGHADKLVSFDQNVDTLEAASKSCEGTGARRDIRERTPTGYVQDQEDGALSVAFKEEVSYVKAASISSTEAKRIRDRVPTGYISDMVEPMLRPSGSVSFAVHVDDVDAASRGCVGQAADIRHRVPTGFIHLEEVLPGEVRYDCMSKCQNP